MSEQASESEDVPPTIMPAVTWTAACDYCGWRGVDRSTAEDADVDRRQHRKVCPVWRTP